MKERVRDYEPNDPRSRKQDRQRRNEIAEGGMADEFEALFSMRDQTTPEHLTRSEKAQEGDRKMIESNTSKGFER